MIEGNINNNIDSFLKRLSTLKKEETIFSQKKKYFEGTKEEKEENLSLDNPINRDLKNYDYFINNWDIKNDEQLIYFNEYCSVNRRHYIFPVFGSEFIKHQEDYYIHSYIKTKSPNICGYFRENPNEIYEPQFNKYPKSWKSVFRELPPDKNSIYRNFRNDFSIFIEFRLKELYYSKKLPYYQRERFCKIRNLAFKESEFRKSYTIGGDGLIEIEALQFYLDIHPSEMDCFRRIGTDLEVKSSLKDLRVLLDFLGFIPDKNTSIYKIYRSMPREKFYEFINYAKKVYYPIRYASIYGEWLKAIIESGFLGQRGVLKGKFGYKVIAKDGHLCNSLAEKIIDDWLFENSIEHEKEPKYPKAVIDFLGSNIRADWKIGEYYIEYFGLHLESNYAEKMNRKINACNIFKIKLISLFPGDEYLLNERIKSILLSKN